MTESDLKEDKDTKRMQMAVHPLGWSQLFYLRLFLLFHGQKKSNKKA